jgi:hypothetical protein
MMQGKSGPGLGARSDGEHEVYTARVGRVAMADAFEFHRGS